MKKIYTIIIALIVSVNSFGQWNELGGTNSLMANGWIHTICADDSGNTYAAGNFTNLKKTN